MAGLSKLRAVNICLENIGESPVSSLTGTSGDAFVSTAETILDEVARATCNMTWHFNREYEYSMAPDVSNNIVMADNVLWADATYDYLHYTVRDGKLYDMDNQTFSFTDSVLVDLVWELTFEELPQYVRSYVAIRAARIFARRMVADVEIEQLTAQDESEARTNAKRLDLRGRDKTVWSSPSLYRLRNRRNVY